MNNPEKLSILGTQDENKRNKNTTQYALDTPMRKQTHIMLIKHEHLKTTGSKDEPNIVLVRKS